MKKDNDWVGIATETEQWLDYHVIDRLMRDNRSIRRFDQRFQVPYEQLAMVVWLAGDSASARNAQPLRYRYVFERPECKALFPHLRWAGYYKDWDGPAEGERPNAYIVQCLDTTIIKDSKEVQCDAGLQLQAITLGLTAFGAGSCIIGAFDRKGVRGVLDLDEVYEPLYVVAVGKAGEEVRMVPMDPLTDDYRYYRDENDVQCVPKRAIGDLVIHPGRNSVMCKYYDEIIEAQKKRDRESHGWI